MAEFLTTRLVSAELEKLINKANAWIFLVSPFNSIPDTIFQCIKSADMRKIKIYFIYGKKKLDSDTEEKLKQLKNLDLYYCDNLHAKCYFNENTMIITSMNLYAYSDQNNREMGVLLKQPADAQIYEEAYQEVKRIMENSPKVVLEQTPAKFQQPRPRPQPQPQYTQPQQVGEGRHNRSTDTGYCVRCGEKTPYNVDRPHCDKCFKSWNKYGDPDYSEKFCHQCGRKADTTKDHPRCGDCNPDAISSFFKGIFG